MRVFCITNNPHLLQFPYCILNSVINAVEFTLLRKNHGKRSKKNGTFDGRPKRSSLKMVMVPFKVRAQYADKCVVIAYILKNSKKIDLIFRF